MTCDISRIGGDRLLSRQSRSANR